MRAETAFNVVRELPNEELERFYGMLGVVPAKLGKPNKPLMTDEQATEFLIGKIKKSSRKAG